MTTFEQRIARIEELEKKRTQGVWFSDFLFQVNADADADSDYEVLTIADLDRKEFDGPDKQREANAEFIAMTSTEVSFLLEAVKVMREALGSMHYYYCTACEDNQKETHQALTKLEELAKK